MTARKPGLVFAGGGARGFAHAGVLRTLRQNGCEPSVMVGISMGAVVATTYALNPDWYGTLKAIDISGFPLFPDVTEQAWENTF